jgi:hypothetical protein
MNTNELSNLVILNDLGQAYVIMLLLNKIINFIILSNLPTSHVAFTVTFTLFENFVLWYERKLWEECRV